MQIEERLRQFTVRNCLFGRDIGLAGGRSLLEQGSVDSSGILKLVAFLASTVRCHT
jgi:hypothetical protein